MHFTNGLFHRPTYSSYAYQPLSQQDSVSDEAATKTNEATANEKNTYNEPAPLAACRTGNLQWLNEELIRDPSIVHLDFRSGLSGQMAPLLYIAAQNGHTSIVNQLIEAGADVNHGREGGPTPLIIAGENGHVEVVKKLVEKGADVNCSREDGATPLIFAAKKGHIEIVRHLIEKGADVNHATKNTATPLVLAIANGHRDIVRFLLEAGADPTKKRVVQGRFLTKSVSPKYVARHLLKDESVVGMIQAALKHRSIETFRHNPYKEAAPMAACRTGNLKWLNEEIAKDNSVVSTLYKYGKSGRSAPLLAMAAGHGHIEIVKRLIDTGADVNASSSDNSLTPLALASRFGRSDIVYLLLEHGANVDEPDSIGITPLNFAAAIENPDIVEQLIKHGADVNHADKEGVTSLSSAASCGHLTVVKKLIEHGADVNRAKKDGRTPLLRAAFFGHLKVVEHLIRLGARVNQADKQNATPLFVAALNGHRETVACLLKAGADPEAKWQILGSVFTKSPRGAAFINAHDMKIVKMINTAIKQRAVNRTPSEERLVFANDNPEG